MVVASKDPYTIREGEAHPPPSNFFGRLGYLGPSLIVTGAVIGSGELVLTTSLGAVAGWSLLWWLLLSCWCKSLVQAEIARYTIVSGDTYLRAINRLPGRIWRISWPIWLGILAYLPGTMGLGGIFGGTGEALSFLLSHMNIELSGVWCTGIAAMIVSAILSTGSYKWLEILMLPLVILFTITTLICSIAMQFTQYQVSASELLTGLQPDFSAFLLLSALAL